MQSTANTGKSRSRSLALLLGAALLVVAGCDEPTASNPALAQAPATATPTDQVPAQQSDSTDGASADPGVTNGETGWPAWRGPEGRGVAYDAGLPKVWPTAKLTPRWEAKLGTGWSSPVVADGRVFVTDRQGGTERVVALDADTGNVVWESKHPVDFEPHDVGQAHGNGPKSTCTVVDGRVYALGIAGRLKCLDAKSGDIVWQRSLPADFGQVEPLADGRAIVNGTENVLVPIGPGQGAPVPLFGYTGSPVVAGRLLILEVGGARGGTIMAFDRTTGEVVWRALDENVSYSSPIVAEIAGTRQVVAMTGPRVVGLDLKDGRLLWDHPFQIQYDESISTPAVAGDLVLVTADRRPLTALQITRDGSTWSKAVAWTNHDLSSYLSSMLPYRDHVYGMNDGGQWAAIRLADGETVWIDGDHGYYCSPIVADERLLGLNNDGELLVLAASADGYRELGRSQLATSATWTVPAVVDGRIYVRSEDRVACFDLAR